MATGFEQAHSVVAAIAGDLEAADRIELDLRETGVCGLGMDDTPGAESSCCGDASVTATVTIAASAPKGGCGTNACGAKPIVPVSTAATTACCCG